MTNKTGNDNSNRRQVRVAVIGAGNMAREHARAFAAVEQVSLVGIMSRTRSRAEKLAAELDVPGVFDSVSELYTRTKADVVVVAVSVLSVADIVEDCVNYPWAILAEKPIGLSVEESEKVMNFVGQKQAQCYVAFNRRHYSATLEAQRLLSSAEGPRVIQVQDQQDMDMVRDNGHPLRVVEGLMYANSIHLIDYLNAFSRGKLVDVRIIHPWNPADPRLVSASLTFDSGDIGIYHAIWNAPGPWQVSINQGDLRVDLKPLERLSYQMRGSRDIFEFTGSPHDSDFKPGLFRQAAEMTRVISGDEIAGVPTIVDAHETMKLISQIYAWRK